MVYSFALIVRRPDDWGFDYEALSSGIAKAGAAGGTGTALNSFSGW